MNIDVFEGGAFSLLGRFLPQNWSPRETLGEPFGDKIDDLQRLFSVLGRSFGFVGSLGAPFFGCLGFSIFHRFSKCPSSLFGRSL